MPEVRVIYGDGSSENMTAPDLGAFLAEAGRSGFHERGNGLSLGWSASKFSTLRSTKTPFVA